MNIKPLMNLPSLDDGNNLVSYRELEFMRLRSLAIILSALPVSEHILTYMEKI
jgi:hypothetical protein